MNQTPTLFDYAARISKRRRRRTRLTLAEIRAGERHPGIDESIVALYLAAVDAGAPPRAMRKRTAPGAGAPGAGAVGLSPDEYSIRPEKPRPAPRALCDPPKSGAPPQVVGGS